MSKYLDSNGLLYLWGKIKTLLGGKVDKVEGKGLSANDFTTEEKTKLAGVHTIRAVLIGGGTGGSGGRNGTAGGKGGTASNSAASGTTNGSSGTAGNGGEAGKGGSGGKFATFDIPVTPGETLTISIGSGGGGGGESPPRWNH